ncbi:ferric reductase-like transmembrane domain-containing protein [Actinopolymorpha alba]|uniref:ferredoxin reductase family protein n=1 Tax=Actinopolymorpha alba TaxID=533267 RepID=UPI0003764F0F|nr:ferric reductase-like transmembrane domain-containing protein [Actinopolymorpha alba]
MRETASAGVAGRSTVKRRRHRAPFATGPGHELRAYLLRHSPSVLWALIIVGGLAITWLWWSSTLPPRSVGGELTEAGRLTGLYAGYLVIILLALMARIPVLERVVGADRLARVHGMAGRYVVSLVVAHGLLILVGYASTGHTGLVHQALSLLTGYPYVLWAAIGGALFVLVGVLSIRNVRSRMSYEAWYLPHLLTYVGIGLAFLHQIETGAQFVTNPVARLAWIAAYAAVTALLVWCRVVVPLRNSWRHRLVVADVRAEAPGVVSVYLTGSRLAELNAEAGQFLRLRFLSKGFWWQSHPYSLSAAPNPHWLRVTIKALGDHTGQLQGLRPGTKVLAEGPYGALTARRRSRHGVLLVAGGVGVTPLRALFESLPAAPGRLTLLYRATSPVDLVFRHELDQLAAARQAPVHYLLSQSEEHRGDPFHPGSLRQLVPDIAERDVYICGPSGMTDTVIESLRTCGVPIRRIHHEDFTF